MPYNDNAVVVAARGYIFTAPVNTAAPAVADIDSFDPSDPVITGWDNAGHTDRDELPEFGFDGGDQTVLGTWQNASLRAITEDTPVDFVTIRFAQWDSNVLSLYYGMPNSSGEDGVFRVASAPVETMKRGLLIIIVDGTVNVAFYAPNTALKRDDSIEMGVDQFAFLPVRATLLNGVVGGENVYFEWISNDTAIVGS